MSWYGNWDGFDEEMQNAPDIFARKPQTNADRIRAMTDEELARLLASNADCNECRIYSYKDGCMENYDTCVCRWLDWLKQEAKE